MFPYLIFGGASLLALTLGAKRQKRRRSADPRTAETRRLRAVDARYAITKRMARANPSPERSRRIKKALAETEHLLAKEMKYSADLRKPKYLAFLRGHIAKLKGMMLQSNPKGLIGVDPNGIRWSVKKNYDTGEWMCVAYVNGKRNEDKTAYFDDKKDAIDTFNFLMSSGMDHDPKVHINPVGAPNALGDAYRRVRLAHSNSDRAQVLKKMFRGWSKADHKNAAEQHREASIRWHRVWNKAADRAHRETFGKSARSVLDYKVSGIGRDEYPERYKTILRKAAQSASAHVIVSEAHAYAAKHLRIKANPPRRKAKKAKRGKKAAPKHFVRTTTHTVKTVQSNPGRIGLKTAINYAQQLHGGQSSALYSFASTGKVHGAEHRDSLRREIRSFMRWSLQWQRDERKNYPTGKGRSKVRTEVRQSLKMADRLDRFFSKVRPNPKKRRK